MRKLSCCIALLIMLSLTGAAFAQSMPTAVPCGDLSEEDCAILTNAQLSYSSIDSQLFDFSFNIDISEIPGMDEPLTFSVTGSGSSTGMAAMQSHMTAMQTSMLGTPDFNALQASLGEIADALREFGGDLNMTLTLPSDLMAMVSPNAPDTINLQIRMVDGVGYLNLDPLQPILRSAGMSGMSGWVGMDIVGLMQAAFAELDPDMIPSGMDMMTSNDAMLEYVEALSDPEFLADFMTIERTDDGSGATAVFEFTFDFGALMSSSAFQNMMRAQMQAQMEASGATISEEEIGEVLAMTSQMMKGITMTMTEEIGLEDGFIHSISGSMHMDMRGMMTAMGEDAEDAPVIDMTFSANYSSFNSAPEITAPEDAMIIPYESLFRAGGSVEASVSTPLMEMTPTPTHSS